MIRTKVGKKNMNERQIRNSQANSQTEGSEAAADGQSPARRSDELETISDEASSSPQRRRQDDAASVSPASKQSQKSKTNGSARSKKGKTRNPITRSEARVRAIKAVLESVENTNPESLCKAHIHARNADVNDDNDIDNLKKAYEALDIEPPSDISEMSTKEIKIMATALEAALLTQTGIEREAQLEADTARKKMDHFSKRALSKSDLTSIAPKAAATQAQGGNGSANSGQQVQGSGAVNVAASEYEKVVKEDIWRHDHPILNSISKFFNTQKYRNMTHQINDLRARVDNQLRRNWEEKSKNIEGNLKDAVKRQAESLKGSGVEISGFQDLAPTASQSKITVANFSSFTQPDPQQKRANAAVADAPPDGQPGAAPM